MSAAIIFPAMLMIFLLLVQIVFWGVGNMAAEAAARRGAVIAGQLNPSFPPGPTDAPTDAEATALCAGAEQTARREAGLRANRWSFARLDGQAPDAIGITWNNRWVEVEVRMVPSVSFFGWRWPITSTARSLYDNWGETNLYC